MPEYDICIKPHLWGTLEQEIKTIYRHDDLFVITDEHVYALYHKALTDALPHYHVAFCVVKPGELSKSPQTYHQVIEIILKVLENLERLAQVG